ncbi:uncharacterized protein [Lolium perenne]|uniref:uncharacterized protein n=1 Tax=Lolium perenne TaxID=4522 RepID=UPI0021F5A1E7|nr:flocculation protein FLO11-like [Lolium perenne]
MSSRLLYDPHPRTTKKASASAAAVQLLLRRSGSGRAAAKDESIEFFSALRECQHDRRVSGQIGIGPADRRGKARRSGGETELLSTETGKHDYDWLLTPPATPLCFPVATSGTTAALNRLTRATSASYAKSNSPLSLTRRENGNPTSRLARSSSASHSSSVNTSAFASSYRPSQVRTLSSASLSSINAPSNASRRSTSSGSAATSPRTPATARSAAAASSPTRSQGKAQVSSSSSGAARQPMGSSLSNSRPSAPTIARPRAPTTAASSLKSTRVASEHPTQTTRRGANAVARSRFASQLSSAMSTAQPAQNDVRSSITKPRSAPTAVKQCHGNGAAAMSRTASTQSWLSASLSASRGELLASKGASRSGDYSRKIKVTPPRQAAGLASAATSSGLTRTGSRKSANADAKRAVNEDLRPTVQHRSMHSSIASRSRLGSASTSSAAGSIARGRRATTQKGKATVTARVTGADAFPSTRYDAMLLREDPKNLTWLNGCGEDDGDEDGICGVGLVEGSLELEPFSVAVTGTSGAAA